MESTIYTIDGKKFELQHHGVKGMKWGRRKARPKPTGTGRRGGQATDSPEAQAARKEARRAKVKKIAKYGAIFVGSALVTYGTLKVRDVVRDKNYNYRMKQGSKAIDAYLKRTAEVRMPTSDWRVRRDREARDQQFMERIYNSASRQADKDSFRTALENVLYDYLDERQRR